MMKHSLLLVLTVCMSLLSIKAYSAEVDSKQVFSKEDFSSCSHPRVLVTSQNREELFQKFKNVEWTQDLVEHLHRIVDPILDIHLKDPSYVPSRLQMHWEDGKHYTEFRTEGNFITHRSGNAKYPTVRVPYARATSNSAPLVPLDKIIPYSDGVLLKPKGDDTPFVNPMLLGEDLIVDFGRNQEYDSAYSKEIP